MNTDPLCVSPPTISICVLASSHELTEQLKQVLGSDRYACLNLTSAKDFLSFVSLHKHQIDCLILENNAELPAIARELHITATLLPTIILSAPSQAASDNNPDQSREHVVYHKAEVYVSSDEMTSLTGGISQAVNQFMKLAMIISPELEDVPQDNWASQDQNLSDKLNERLGYLGFFYKRSSTHFYRNLTKEAQQSLLKEIRTKYREIIVHYFQEESDVNQQIDLFVNMVFFADLPTAQIIEIHMDLMEVLGNQLKVQGRNEEFLLSYRLALIDTIAHLCEIYRRSIHRES